MKNISIRMLKLGSRSMHLIWQLLNGCVHFTFGRGRGRTRRVQPEGNASDVFGVVEAEWRSGNWYEAKEIRTRKKHSSQWILISFFFHFFSFGSFSGFNLSCRHPLIWGASNMFRFGIFFLHLPMSAVRACGAPKTQMIKMKILL